MNFDILKPDKNCWMTKNYKVGRKGHKVNKIVVHHNAGNLTTEGCRKTWNARPPERPASAHYQVEADGTIGQLVKLANTAYHAGNLEANYTSIGVEHANTSNKAPWAVPQKTLDAGAHLVAALCLKFKLGEPTWGKNVFPHKYFDATACPGELAGTQQDEYIRKAKDYYRAMQGKPQKQQLSKGKKTIDELAKEVMAGRWGNDPERSRRLIAAGYAAKEVQAEVTRRMNSSRPQTLQPGDTVRLKPNSFIYGTTRRFSSWCYDPSVVFTVHSIKGDRAVIQRQGKVIGAVKPNHLQKV